jgi:predicted Zn-dependent protease
MELIGYCQHAGQYAQMYECARKYVSLYPEKDVLGLKYAHAMLLSEKYDECAAFLDRLDVLPGEGAREGHRIYREAWLNLALQSIGAGDYATALTRMETARQWPEHLGVGKPYDEEIDLRAEDFLTAWCHEQMNDAGNATDYYERVIARKDPNANELLSAIALLHGNDRSAATERIRTFAAQGNNWVSKWCKSEYDSGFSRIFPAEATSGQEATDPYFSVVRKIIACLQVIFMKNSMPME